MFYLILASLCFVLCGLIMGPINQLWQPIGQIKPRRVPLVGHVLWLLGASLLCYACWLYLR
jgi:hypothetical protein